MFGLIGTLTFYASVVCLIIGLVLLAAGAFLMVGGLFGLLVGGSTSLVLFGATIPLGVLGQSAVVLGIIVFLVGMFFCFIALVLWLIWTRLIPWLQTLARGAGLPAGFTSTGLGGGSTASPFSMSNLLLPVLPAGLGLWDLLFLTDEQRLKLPPNVIPLLNCLRGCMCETLCGKDTHGGGTGGLPDPGKVIVDTSKQLLDDLRAQLEVARTELEHARHGLDAEGIAYWTNKMADLSTRIGQLGGS